MGLSRNSQSYVKQIVSSDILDRKYSLILKPVELNVSTGYFFVQPYCLSFWQVTIFDINGMYRMSKFTKQTLLFYQF